MAKNFDSYKYDELCWASRIKRELHVPYNPQQNGVAERKNRTIYEAARAMMYDQNLPLFLWVEAASTAVYIQNMSPHKSLEEKTPEEVFTGINPLFDHLRIFGSPVYIHIPKEKRNKLEAYGKKGTFVGYSETSKDYIIYIPVKISLRSIETQIFMKKQLFVMPKKFHVIQRRRKLHLLNLQIHLF
jgi:hypothetical protein